MTRIACFAHYDKNNKIEDYVIRYLKGLKEVADKIIFASDSDIDNEELKKISPYIEHSIIGKHNEYDFGSYKRAFLYAKENNLLNNCEELIFANDSCYAPLFSFEEMFSEMSPKNIDFWGVTLNPIGFSIEHNKYIEKPLVHIQSFFLVFKQKIFLTTLFEDFIKSISKQDKKEKVIAYYEIGLSQLLINNGYKYDVYCESSKTNVRVIIELYENLIKKNRIPLLKRSIILKKDIQVVYPIFIEDLIKKYTDYDYELICKDRKNNTIKVNILKDIYYRMKTIYIRFFQGKFQLFKKEQNNK